MPRFYFHVVGREAIADLDGTEIPDADLEKIRREAVKDARAILSEAALAGRDLTSWQIEVHDEHGVIVLVFPFSAALTPD